jgi:hypothetical protein
MGKERLEVAMAENLAFSFETTIAKTGKGVPRLLGAGITGERS